MPIGTIVCLFWFPRSFEWKPPELDPFLAAFANKSSNTLFTRYTYPITNKQMTTIIANIMGFFEGPTFKKDT